MHPSKDFDCAELYGLEKIFWNESTSRPSKVNFTSVFYELFSKRIWNQNPWLLPSHVRLSRALLRGLLRARWKVTKRFGLSCLKRQLRRQGSRVFDCQLQISKSTSLLQMSVKPIRELQTFNFLQSLPPELSSWSNTWYNFKNLGATRNNFSGPLHLKTVRLGAMNYTDMVHGTWYHSHTSTGTDYSLPFHKNNHSWDNFLAYQYVRASSNRLTVKICYGSARFEAINDWIESLEIGLQF